MENGMSLMILESVNLTLKTLRMNALEADMIKIMMI